MTTPSAYFVAALLMSLVLTPVCRSLAYRLGLTARPSEDRWHQRSTALFGGVAIVIPTLVLGLTLGSRDHLLELIGCTAAMAAFGLLDDLLSLKPSTKLVAQIAIASMLLFFGYRLQWTSSMVGDAMLTVFWIVGLTNAFNLLDNMDGLAAGTALVAGACLLFVFAGEGALDGPRLYLLALMGSTAGFLVYNFHPASIFMGDTGSLFLGMNLGVLTLLAQPHGAARTGVLSVMAVPVLLLLVPILDTTMVTAIRLLSGRRASQGGRDHTSHRLVAIGLSQRTAVGILWLVAAAGGGVALSFQSIGGGWGVIVGGGFLLAVIIFAVFLARVRVYDGKEFMRLREGSITPLVVNFMYKRRVAEVLLDLCLIPLAYSAAYHLRFEGALLLPNYPMFLQSLPVVLAAQLLALFVVGGYRGAWRHFGMMDAVVFGKGVLFGTVASQLVLLYAYRYVNYSRAVFVIYAALLFLLLTGTRASFRLLSEFVHRRQSDGERCVVYGTGGASMSTIREAFGDGVALRIVGLVDDDPQQQNLRVGGYPVLGDFGRLLDMIDRKEVDCVVLNTCMIDVERLLNLEARCQDRGIRLLRLHLHVHPFVAAS